MITAEMKLELDRRLARKLCAAFLSENLGIGMDYALKTYVKEDVGQYWYALVDFIRSNPPILSIGQSLPEPPKKSI